MHVRHHPDQFRINIECAFDGRALPICLSWRNSEDLRIRNGRWLSGIRHETPRRLFCRDRESNPGYFGDRLADRGVVHLKYKVAASRDQLGCVMYTIVVGRDARYVDRFDAARTEDAAEAHLVTRIVHGHWTEEALPRRGPLGISLLLVPEGYAIGNIGRVRFDVDDDVVHGLAMLRSHLDRGHPCVVGKAAGNGDVPPLDSPARGNRVRWRFDHVTGLDLPSVWPGNRGRCLRGITGDCPIVHPTHEGVHFAHRKAAVVGKVPVLGVRKPWRHLLGHHGGPNRLRPRASAVVREKRHRCYFARPMTWLAAFLQNRQNVTVERHVPWRCVLRPGRGSSCSHYSCAERDPAIHRNTLLAATASSAYSLRTRSQRRRVQQIRNERDDGFACRSRGDHIVTRPAYSRRHERSAPRERRLFDRVMFRFSA